MCRLCKENNIPDRKINKKVTISIHKIIKQFKPNKILLYGSFARQDYHKGSDVDIIVVGNFKERFIERIGKILELNDTDIYIEPLAYTPKEFEKMLKERRPFIETVVREGITIYTS